jgi:type II restriction/modification system DNA methylase subunit YeeA
MNTKNLKAYAPKARRQFIEAIKKRAAQLGIYEDRFAEVQVEGGAAIIEGRAFTKKQGEQRKRLAQKIDEKPLTTHKERYNLFISEMAYTWFNRLAAIRYMELHDYLEHGFRVLSNPNSPDSLPEILDHASDVVDILDPNSAANGQRYLDKNHIIELQLAGNKEEELYRELLLGQCHYLYNIMPFMFEAIDDASELLLPDNLTKTDSILKGLVNEIPEEDWSQIEVIGWLYQFYISEHKDAVIGKVVKSEDIPAATQLFTPNWIVKYLVQNSLGRQWLATYPESELKGKMEYYIEPAEQSDDVIKQLKAITPSCIDPEQIKVLDPAAGSGHILVEVYEVLREIYLERGYRLREIPELILTKNIYGLDIDDRAAQLAGFALMMKAREDDRRIFQRVQDGDVQLNVYSLQSSEGLDIGKLWAALDLEDKHQKGTTGGLFDEFDQRETFEYQVGDKVTEAIIPAQAGIYSQYYKLIQTLKVAFLQAKTFGSLIQIDNQHLANLLSLKELLEGKQQSSDPATKQAVAELVPIVNQALSLTQQYDSVIANPPYMGSGGMNSEVKKFTKDQFPDAKNDLFACFMERSYTFAKINGYCSMVTMQNWMFLSSYEAMRLRLLREKTINAMAQIGFNSFPSMNSKVAQAAVFTFINTKVNNYYSTFTNLNNAPQSADKREVFLARAPENQFVITAEEFKKIPGSPVTYWVSKKVFDTYESEVSIGSISNVGVGLQTGDNNRFIRDWFELSVADIGFRFETSKEAEASGKKWFPCNKGGEYRKWYGNQCNVIDWRNDGAAIKSNAPSSVVRNEATYFLPIAAWSKVTSGGLALRYFDSGFVHNDASCVVQCDTEDSLVSIISAVNSVCTHILFSSLNPTLNFVPGQVSQFPLPSNMDNIVTKISQRGRRLISLTRQDWDSYEISWGFKSIPYLKTNSKLCSTLESSFTDWLKQKQDTIDEVKCLEEENNSFFINAYGLADELTPDVTIEQITLTVNPAYRYGIKKSEEERNTRFREDTMQELMSYAIGCMMGRYSLVREGLVYANSGNEGFKELVAEGAYQTYPADADGIIPLATEDWLFDDDATTRFREFVSTVWGAEHLSENLAFVAESLCLHALKPKKGEGAMDTIRRYFSTQLFKEHCKTYKKRPIYWLFSSGKEKAFECLVYLHRYTEGTLSRMRTEYVTPLMGKYEHHHSSLQQQILEGSTEQKRLAEKALKDLEKKQAELRTFDEQLKHYAEMRISLDLDDGVKVNYGKFGNLLADVKNIHGQAVK